MEYSKEKFDPELAAWFNNKLEKGEIEDIVNQLYGLLDIVNQEIRKKVYQARAAWKRKTNAPVRKAARARVEAFFASMTPDELIKFQNTPWEELPEWLKEDLPKLVRHPEENNYVRIYDLVNKEQRQKEITASRITRYMENHGFITSNEEGTHLHYDKFAEVCNQLAEKYDLPWAHGKRMQKVRITKRDLQNYTECRVTPKGDKMAILAQATELPLWYLGGYLNNTEPEIAPKDPLAAAPLTSGKFKKTRAKRA